VGRVVANNSTSVATSRKSNFIKYFHRYKYLYLLSLPGIILLIIFKYLPMFGLIVAFQDYSPYRGFLNSDWVGFANFQRFFSSPYFFKLLRNTLAISLMNLFFFFPAPIIIALMLNEVTNYKFKKIIQTTVYLPHFLSWVIIFALTFLMFSQQQGIVNKILPAIGLQKIDVLTNPKTFWAMLTAQTMWKEAGWGTIIFLASLSGIDPQLYEACVMDGGSRWRQLWHITLPGIRPVIITLLILRMGSIIDTSFEQVYLMQNGAVAEVSDVFDTFVYRFGVQQGQYGFSSSVGMFKSLIGLVFVLGTNKLSKLFGQDGIM
jgi:putative aldouronate transport system permease protein